MKNTYHTEAEYDKYIETIETGLAEKQLSSLNKDQRHSLLVCWPVAYSAGAFEMAKRILGQLEDLQMGFPKNHLIQRILSMVNTEQEIMGNEIEEFLAHRM